MLARLRLSPALIVSLLALVVALGGTAVAVTTSFVGSDGKIHGCVGKGGALSVVKPGGTCPRGESTLSWIQSVSGPAGGALSGRYPNPTLRPAKLVGFAVQPSSHAVDCFTHFNTLCGYASTGNYWNQPPSPWAFSGYWVDSWGFVHLEGSVWMVGNPIATIAVLPPKVRPAGRLDFSSLDVSSGAQIDVYILHDGSIAVIGSINSGDVLSLSGITYHP
jgi:hypothetical protein